MVNKLFRSALQKGLELNEMVAGTAVNASDWLFRKDILIQSGKTEYDVVGEASPMRVRYYAPEANSPTASLVEGEEETQAVLQHGIPLVLVPPLGVTTETFDLMPHRSLVKYYRDAGYRVYMIDWGTPTKDQAHLSLHDYCHDLMQQGLQAVRKHSGSEEISLYGWCMGGLMCLLYAGLGLDKNIKNIVTVASPIDLRDGKNIMAVGASALNVTARFIRKYSEFRLDQLNPSRLGLPGWMVSLGFKLTAPVASVTSYWDLITNLSDRKFIEQHTTTSDYLNNMRLYPGGVIRDFMVRFAIDNHMAKGKIKLGEKVSDLSNIEASLLVFAGETDHLVPPSMAKRSLDLVSSKDKTFLRAPGGHMGVILGSKARNNVWQIADDWLQTRSASQTQLKEAALAAEQAA